MLVVDLLPSFFTDLSSFAIEFQIDPLAPYKAQLTRTLSLNILFLLSVQFDVYSTHSFNQQSRLLVDET